jgi:hypothetical protein
MSKQSLKIRFAVVLSILLINMTPVLAQEAELKITRPETTQKSYQRSTLTGKLERESAFGRLHKGRELYGQTTKQPDQEFRQAKVWEKELPVTTALTVQSFGTGGGDVNEVEPNNLIAQGVSLPVNVFGRISFDGDVDYFAFQGLAGQRIVIEPFASRLRNSDLVADLGLFNASGQLLTRVFGNAESDPLLTYTPAGDEVLIIGLADVDDFGGSSYDYILNITRGTDADEIEPNDRTAQNLPALPATIFGDILVRDDVDFYSFIGEAGQTLIVDVDAEVFGSRLDAEMNLQDPQTGQEYFYNDQWDGDDPRFNIVLPYSGRYVIGIGAFNQNSTGFYRLNASLVSKAGAPLLTRLTRLAKKSLEVEGVGFTTGAIVEVNGIVRNTTGVSATVLRAKVKIKVGDVVTVINPPDARRSNPMVMQ